MSLRFSFQGPREHDRHRRSLAAPDLGRRTLVRSTYPVNIFFVRPAFLFPSAFTAAISRAPPARGAGLGPETEGEVPCHLAAASSTTDSSESSTISPGVPAPRAAAILHRRAWGGACFLGSRKLPHDRMLKERSRRFSTGYPGGRGRRSLRRGCLVDRGGGIYSRACPSQRGKVVRLRFSETAGFRALRASPRAGPWS
jgi:hypothetical protein